MPRLEKLREMPCALSGNSDHRDAVCYGPTVAHHHTHGRGIGQKVNDERTFPLCDRHHKDFHDARGLFREMNKAARRAWQDMMVERYDRILCDPEAF